MWVKICGNTRLEDCQRAADAGADAVGFVFAAGKRTVTAAQVAAITSKLPASLEKIGVFASRDATEIAETAIAAGLTGVQLHGSPDRTLLESLLESRFVGKTIQVLHWRTDVSPVDQSESFVAAMNALNDWDLTEGTLIDSQTMSASGGTGVPFNWEAVAPLIHRPGPAVIAAGGLTAANVADAVKVLQPWGVDTSSGVEDAPGVKNAEAMRQFIANARAAAAK